MGQKEATRVPVVRVRLVNSVRLLPLQSMMATVELEKGQELDGPFLLEPTHRFSEAEELQFGSSLVYPTENRCAAVILTNLTGFIQKLKRGMWVGRGSEAEIISKDSQEILSEDEGKEASSEQHVHDQTQVCVVTVEEGAEWRKWKLAESVCDEPPLISLLDTGRCQYIQPPMRRQHSSHQGLYEFQVMPFGLKNAPTVFQQLMQRVLHGLKPEEGPDFVSVYLDDVLVFQSEILEARTHGTPSLCDGSAGSCRTQTQSIQVSFHKAGG